MNKLRKLMAFEIDELILDYLHDFTPDFLYQCGIGSEVLMYAQNNLESLWSFHNMASKSISNTVDLLNSKHSDGIDWDELLAPDQSESFGDQYIHYMMVDPAAAEDIFSDRISSDIHNMPKLIIGSTLIALCSIAESSINQFIDECLDDFEFDKEMLLTRKRMPLIDLYIDVLVKGPKLPIQKSYTKDLDKLKSARNNYAHRMSVEDYTVEEGFRTISTIFREIEKAYCERMGMEPPAHGPSGEAIEFYDNYQKIVEMIGEQINRKMEDKS